MESQRHMMDAQEKFRAGELVVHPAYGFCRIQKIEWSRNGSRDEECYVFLVGPAANLIKISVPVARAASAGLRRPIAKEQAGAILRVFELPAQTLGPTSKAQIEEIAHRLESADPFEAAAMIRDLMVSGVDGWLGQTSGSFVNQHRSKRLMLWNALDRLIQELAQVQGVSRKRVEDRIRICLKRKRREQAVSATVK